jgi:hypothetical protein
MNHFAVRADAKEIRRGRGRRCCRHGGWRNCSRLRALGCRKRLRRD